MKAKKAPANVGEVFAVPLEDKRFGIARVLEVRKHYVSVLGLDYVGKRPTFEDSAGLRPLREPSVGRDGSLSGPPTPILRWVNGTLPKGFILLGTRPVTAAEARLKCEAYGGFENVTATILIQWLRQNNPRAAEKLFAKWRAESKRAAEQQEKAERARRAELTLPDLAKSRFLPGWSGRFSAKVVKKARAILREVVDDFAKLPKKSTPRDRTAIVRRGVEALNAIDGMDGLSITTLEREELCEAINDICIAAGWRPKNDVTERWRDW